MISQVRRLDAAPEVAQELRRRSRSTTISARDRERATIILLRLEGIGVDAVAQRLRTTPKRVSLWSRRFAAAGLGGLNDQPGRGRKPSIPEAKVAQVITEATRPLAGRSRWSIRSMGRHAGISASSVQRIWSSNSAAVPMKLAIERIRFFAQRFELAEDRPAVREQLLVLLGSTSVAGRQVHDTNIVATMLASGITRLLTFNVADFRRFGDPITVASP